MKEYSLTLQTELRRLMDEDLSIKARRILPKDFFFVHFIKDTNDPWAQIEILDPSQGCNLPGPGNWVYVPVSDRLTVVEAPKQAQEVPCWTTEKLKQVCAVTDHILLSGEGVTTRRTPRVRAVVLRQEVVLRTDAGFKLGEIGDYLVSPDEDPAGTFDIVIPSVWQQDFSKML